MERAVRAGEHARRRRSWFGTLRAATIEGSWLYNPRAAFEFAPVEYTSIDELPPIVTATARTCIPEIRRRIDLVYWTNRDRTPRRLFVIPDSGGGIVTFTVPTQPSPTAVYYYFAACASDGRP